MGGGFTNYCHWPINLFTEGRVLEAIPTEVFKKQYEAFQELFVGGKEEVILHNILERANYQCECDGSLCGLHNQRCGTMHVKRGGKSPLLLQPKTIKKAHSEENSQVMCAQCATANTVNVMTINRKKKKAKPSEGQTSII